MPSVYLSVISVCSFNTFPISTRFRYHRQIFCMLYCCGSKDEEKERPDAKNPGVERPKSNKSEPTQESAHRPLAMYGVAAGMPELLPPFGVIQPGAGSSREPNEGPGLGTRFNRGEVSFDSPQRRLGHRAPKLGQIGRSKRGECGR